MAKGVIALMGSGETAPSMTKVHRALLSRLDEVNAVALDTSYAFQANVPQMTEKIVEYFTTSLNVTVKPLHYGSHDETPPLDGVRFRQEVRDANYLFAGPGSPSFALAQWQEVGLTLELEHVLASDGIVCFASAAALTLGAHTAPIYEIYKAGAKPHWLPGLDLLSLVGLKCAVIPHYDNAEGGNYDTRFCYLGEERLLQMEETLDDKTGILGIDEHTAALIDLSNMRLSVVGRANAYWRVHGETMVLTNGSKTPLSELSANDIRQLRPRLISPKTDIETLVSQAQLPGDEGMEALAQLARRAESSGSPDYDPSTLVEGLVTLRTSARREGNFALADAIRDLLLRANIEVMDSSEATRWTFARK